MMMTKMIDDDQDDHDDDQDVVLGDLDRVGYKEDLIHDDGFQVWRPRGWSSV